MRERFWMCFFLLCGTAALCKAAQPGQQEPVYDMYRDRNCRVGIPQIYAPVEPMPPSAGILEAAKLTQSNSASLLSPPELFERLVEQGTEVSVLSTEAGGKITYLVGAVSAKNQAYRVLQDTAWYRTVQVTESNEVHYYRVGVAIRVSANFVAKEAGVALEGLAPLGLSGKVSSLSGTLSTRAIGLNGRDVPIFLPALTEFSVSALNTTIQGVSAAKVRVWDGVHVPSIPDALRQTLATVSGLSDADRVVLQAALDAAEGRQATRIVVEPLVLAIGICPLPGNRATDKKTGSVAITLN